MNSNRKTRGIFICSLVAAGILLFTGSDANADFVFGTPTNMGPIVNSSGREDNGCLTADGLTFYFTSDRPGGSGGSDIWVTTRETIYDPWGEPVNLGPTVNSSAVDVAPTIAVNGELYFSSNRAGGLGGDFGLDVWMTTRASSSEPWSTPANLGPPINSTSDDSGKISFDGLSLVVNSDRPGGSGGQDLWIATRPTLADAWSDPVNLGPTVNSTAWDWETALSADNRFLFFTSRRSGGLGNSDLWLTTRATTNDPWPTPINLGPMVNSSDYDSFPGISYDGSTLFFLSNRPGGSGHLDLWQVSIEPIVDFNGDYKVDIEDLIILIEHWGQSEPLVDIGPSPLGDGVVDAADLEVFMSYWGQKLPDPHFLAHWRLDETEGMFAADSVGGNSGFVLGNAVWQPEGGQLQGALAFDGIDDLVGVKLVLNPSEGPFSVFAWVKGGAPGQVIFSQQTGVNWLQVHADGTIMTELRSSGHQSSPLYSETVITDGNWHRVGFVWDGSQRVLYVDDIPVALDDQSSLAGAKGGLVIGTGTGNQAGTFWSGMIDDVQIYDRAVEP